MVKKKLLKLISPITNNRFSPLFSDFGRSRKSRIPAAFCLPLTEPNNSGQLKDQRMIKSV